MGTIPQIIVLSGPCGAPTRQSTWIGTGSNGVKRAHVETGSETLLTGTSLGGRVGADPRYTFTNTPEDAAVSGSLRADIEGAGLPWLERISTWEGAAEHFRKQRWRYDKAADFLLIAGRLEEAHAATLEGIHSFEVEGRKDNFEELPRLKRRLARYFSEGQEK